MISGILAISIAFVAAAVSAAAFWLFYRDRDERFYQLASRSFAVMVAGIVFSVVLLYYNIFTHNFQLNYVYSYTSLKLSTYYLISTFWGGQEGTFLLWLLYGSVFGIILIRTVARREPMVLFFVLLVQAFILLILLKKSPFAMLWHVHANAPVGIMPADGQSLNPLLQNPWMIIHPPIMFMGYSSTVVAFAFALNAMVKRQFHAWVKMARPWVIFSAMMLGTGIIMGGYWSYVTLGWGGYWAWDPVENASFVPWVFSLVLLHGLIIQNRQKGLVKTNLALAALMFISVLWGSFLTRSGVLADFSVHSFAEAGLNIYLVGFVALFTGIFLFLFIKTFKNSMGSRFAEGLFSRETFILIGMLTLLFTGTVVFIATSSPIYTGLFGQPSNVSIEFYNVISIPIAVFLLASMAIAPLLAWKISEFRNPKVVGISAAASFFITLIAVVLGMNRPVSILLVFLSFFAVAINGYVAFKFVRKIPAKSGPYLAHAGIALMIIGIISSSIYNRSEKVTLPAGQFTTTQFGYDVQFVSFVQSPDGKDRVRLIVKTPKGSYYAEPQFYYSEYTKSYMLSPHVDMDIAKDIYISPISFMPGSNGNQKQVRLSKNQQEDLGELKMTFNRFVTGDHTDQAPMTVKADLSVSVKKGDAWQDFNVQPAIWMENNQLASDEVQLPDTDYSLKIEALDANNGSVTLSVNTPLSDVQKSPDILAVEISEKPFISVLWFGTIIMILGVAMSLYDRVKHQHQ
ncbi:MAG: cytochrome c biogenesis protein CcsA [Calditrichia bacterium]